MSVVVSTFDRANLIGDLVASLRAQTATEAEFIIVDNGSDPRTDAALQAAIGDDARFHVLRIDRNRGPARARNLGWRASRRPWVAFTDDDCLPEATWLEALVAATAGDAQAGLQIVQGRTTPVDPDEPAGWFDRSVTVTRWSGLFETCNLLVAHATLDALDGFCEDFPDAMGEDTDFGLRAIDAGATTAFEANAMVRHRIWRHGFRDYCRQGRRYARSVDVVRRHPGARPDLLVGRYFIRWSHAAVWAAAPLAVVSVLAGVPWALPAVAGVACGALAHRRRDLPAPLPARVGYAAATLVGTAYETAWFAVESVRHRTVVL